MSYAVDDLCSHEFYVRGKSNSNFIIFIIILHVPGLTALSLDMPLQSLEPVMANSMNKHEELDTYLLKL